MGSAVKLLFGLSCIKLHAQASGNGRSVVGFDILDYWSLCDPHPSPYMLSVAAPARQGIKAGVVTHSSCGTLCCATRQAPQYLPGDCLDGKQT